MTRTYYGKTARQLNEAQQVLDEHVTGRRWSGSGWRVMEGVDLGPRGGY
jgi:hypothetical protein